MKLSHSSVYKKSMVILFIIPMLLAACGAPGTEDQAQKNEDEKKTVVISVTESNRFLEYAEHAFEEKHPDVDIVIKSYRETQELGENQMGIGMTQEEFEKYVSTVNTEMMSGKGPDILTMGSLPVEQYAAKQLLVNFYDMMSEDPDFDKEQFFQNIWDAMEIRDGLYSLPIGVAISTTQANQEILNQAGATVSEPWTWEDLDRITQQVKEKLGPDYYAGGNNKPEFYLYDQVRENYVQLVDATGKKAHFDSPLFKQLIEQVQSMYRNGTLTEETVDYEHAIFNNMSIMKMSYYTNFSNNKTLMTPSMDKKHNQIAFSAASYGLNNNSPVKQEAWEFLKYLLSDEMQQSPDLRGLPIRKAIYNKQFDELIDQVKNGSILSDANDDSSTSKSKELEQLRPLIEKANTNKDSDNKVLNIVLEETQAYFAGQKAIEEVVHLIQNRVTTYLNE
ncbi:ABC transporter substrate-binding protein [Paenibacillus sp. 1001270B_150601_E10]|uniref:ABC transporter substrate-binding protein n=1 Tax=Paenibacillus sp. 1001270B_150601_E10 TaxID=2787079 RepID=UPI00189D8E25|nr:extracellular solute-binding protein [Paenibacillus sp. 1001270B_150601_E10]